MQKKVRVLGIAPYEGMKTLTASLAQEYPELDLALFVGDLEQGLKIAKSNFYGNYDVILSRGGTAEILRKNLSVPVIDIEISVYDMLCALKLSNGFAGKTALVSFTDLADHTRQLRGLLDFDIDIYPIESLDALEPVFQLVQQGNYHSVLCDAIADTAAKKVGVNSFLITSGIDSIRRALDQTRLLFYVQQKLQDEKLFFQQLVQGQLSHTMVFDNNGVLFFSTLDSPDPDLLNLLRREIPISSEESVHRITRNLNGLLYTIRAQQILSGSHSYTAFFFDVRKTPLISNHAGIRFSTRSEEETAYYNSIFSFIGTTTVFQDEMNRIRQTALPLLITGEDGTGKEYFASAIYISSPLQNNPLISINCSLLNERSWDFLLEHHNSPLADEHSTLYFSNIDALSPERSQQLLSVLSEMDVCQRNRVIFSSVCEDGEYISAVGSLFVDTLCCLTLHLPSLRQISDHIPTLLNLSLSHLNTSIPHQIVGADADAIALLQKFPWPHNFTQFHRVVSEMAITASRQIITSDDVRKLLEKERHVGTFSFKSENAASPLDLNRTLTEINQDVAIRVVAETNGNQTAAAKRLGISRTTLWRLLQK